LINTHQFHELFSSSHIIKTNKKDNTQYGENLASNAGNGKWGTIRHPEKIMIRWVEKEANVGWPANAHLTQALWRATKFVGCYEHATRYKNGKGMCHIQVCRYAKPGMLFVCMLFVIICE
jgi:hypothetical protein